MVAESKPNKWRQYAECKLVEVSETKEEISERKNQRL
jgi:hypothetical protein